MYSAPMFLDVFMRPIRDNQDAQVALVALMALIVLDVLLGFCAAAKDGTVQSSLMREGAWHKLSELGVVALSDIVDGLILGGLDLGYTAPVCTAVIVYLCINEIVSCLENVTKLNPKLKDSPALKWIANVGVKDTDNA